MREDLKKLVIENVRALRLQVIVAMLNDDLTLKKQLKNLLYWYS